MFVSINCYWYAWSPTRVCLFHLIWRHHRLNYHTKYILASNKFIDWRVVSQRTRPHLVLSSLPTIKSQVAASHELMYCVMKTWCWEGGGRKVGESPSHPQSHSPSAQTTTADIRRNKDHVFNDARMILTQRQLDFYVRGERNLAMVCGSAASCISTSNRFRQQVQQIQTHVSQLYSIRDRFEPWSGHQLFWGGSTQTPQAKQATTTSFHTSSDHAILQVLTPGLNTV
jgi:hypothetical protein